MDENMKLFMSEWVVHYHFLEGKSFYGMKLCSGSELCLEHRICPRLNVWSTWNSNTSYNTRNLFEASWKNMISSVKKRNHSNYCTIYTYNKLVVNLEYNGRRGSFYLFIFHPWPHISSFHGSTFYTYL